MIKSKLTEIKQFWRGVAGEVKNLRIPAMPETVSYLITVLLLALFCSLLFFSIDYLAVKVIGKVIQYFA